MGFESHDLSIRLTHKFVGTYQHEDKWQSIGTYVIRSTLVEEIGDPDDGDPCDPHMHRHLLYVICDDPQPEDRIVRALTDCFTQYGCHHEYDCCGCRSYSCHTVERVGTYRDYPLYEVEVNSSRNY